MYIGLGTLVLLFMWPRFMLTMIALVLIFGAMTGCVSAPPCQTELECQQRLVEAAEKSRWNGQAIKYDYGYSGPVTHRQHMCAAGNVNYC